MNVLITGATGSLGKKTAQIFAETQKDWHLTLTGRQQALDYATEGKYFSGNLSSFEFCEQITRGQDCVVHCAAKTHPWGNYADFVTDNVTATENLVKAAIKNKVRRFVFISTPSVYYNANNRRDIPESEHIDYYRTHYARTKLMAEKVLLDPLILNHIEVVMLRPRAIFGPTDKVLLPRMLRVMKSGRFPLINGGRALIDLTYVDNVVQAIKLSMTTKVSTNGEIYNITNGEPTEINVLFLKLAQYVDQHYGIKVKFINVNRPVIMAVAYVLEKIYSLLGLTKEPPLTCYGIGLISYDCTLDISKAKKQLGYQPQVSVVEGFSKTLEGL